MNLSFLFPAALGLLVAAPLAILLIHLFRNNRRRVQVPSLVLWAGLPPARGGWRRRRLPLSLLLLLQLAIAALIALALARPASTIEPPPRHLALVLDASTSMQATDVQPSRFARAVQQVSEQIATLKDYDTVSLIWAGPAVELLSDGPPALAQEALAASRAGSGQDTLHDAIALASRQLTTTPEIDGQVLVYTDGAFPPMQPHGPLTGPVEFIPVDGVLTGNNQAIIDIQVRADAAAPGRQEAFIRVANYASTNAAPTIRLSDAETGQELDEVVLEIPANGSSQALVEVPADVQRLTAELTGMPDDALPLDDRVEVDAPAPGAPVRQVLLVGSTSSSLQRVLAAIPSVELETTTIDDFDPALSEASLTVFEGQLPENLPAGPLMIVDPPVENPLFDGTAADERGTIIDIDVAHPMLRGVDPAALQISPSISFSPPDWARSIAETTAGALLVDGYRDGRPVALLVFDPEETDLDKSLAFPLLISNTITYLINGGFQPGVRPGGALSLPAPEDGRAILVKPDGSRETLQASGPDFWISQTDQTGRYTVVDTSDEQQVLRAFSVHLLDAEASDIRPRDPLAPLIAQPSAEEQSEDDTSSGMAEWWRYLIAGGVVMLGLEWVLFAQRSEGRMRRG